MSLTSYRAAPPRVISRGQRTKAEDRGLLSAARSSFEEEALRRTGGRTPENGRRDFSVLCPLTSVVRCLESVLCGPGDDLLSHVLRQSTIGAKAFDGRVRDGIGSCRLARATRPAKNGSRRTEGGGQIGRFIPPVVRRLSSERSKTGFARDGGWKTEDREAIRPLFSVVRPLKSRLGDKSNQAGRAISTGQLHALLRFHIRPIDVVVFHGSSRENLF
jgi:hypothetical protein